MLEKIVTGDTISRETRWYNGDGVTAIGAQVSHSTGKAFLFMGYPFAGEPMTETEALAIAESFAPTVAVLFSEMRAELAKMRGGR